MIYLWKIILLSTVILFAHSEENQENVNITSISEDYPEIENTTVPEVDTLPSYLDEPLQVNATNTTKTNSTKNQVSCKPHTGGAPVELVNDTRLVEILTPDANVTRDSPGNCVIVLFYAKFCPFSSMAAPHFNALPRAFPDLKFAAIDAMRYRLFNTQNGIVGVPTLLLFHNGRLISKFNDTDYTLDLYSKFVTKYTGIDAVEKSYVTSADFGGPVSSVPEKEVDYFLGLSWVFIILCAVYYFSKSKWWKWIVETVQNTWRESEAQHEHND